MKGQQSNSRKSVSRQCRKSRRKTLLSVSIQGEKTFALRDVLLDTGAPVIGGGDVVHSMVWKFGTRIIEVRQPQERSLAPTLTLRTLTSKSA